jgi:glycosidase
MISNVDNLKKSIIYQILIDRYAGYDSQKDWNKNQFIGGNIKGIIDSLPYLKNLGITIIWISPFYKTSAYHGYHITDFFEVEPQFGTKQELKRLIDLVHQNKMKIIADFVPNHVSHLHPFFIEAKKQKNSKYSDWFYFSNWPEDYKCFLSIKELPKLNLKNIDVKNHIINSAKYWLSFGLDGYRLDHVIGPSNKFWIEFYEEIKKQFPNAFLIGEAWMYGISWKELNTIQIQWKRLKWIRKNSSDKVLQNYIGLLDGVLDFSAQRFFQQFAYGLYSEMQLKKVIQQHYSKFPKHFVLPSFLDNHDMDRFLFQCHNNLSLLKKAATIQFNLPQPVILYYGTEQGISQKTSVWSKNNHGDLLARKPMSWAHDKNNELFNFYRNLIHERMNK